MNSVNCLNHSMMVVCLDDNVQFLEALGVSFEDCNIVSKNFHKPLEFLDHVNLDTYRQGLIKRLLVVDQEEYKEPLHLNMVAFIEEVNNPQRYNQISVVVIDYEMPGMRGLEVCEKIQNPFIKKILLTGVADEKIAIDAFNQGLIYQYVRKQDPNFIQHLAQTIQRAQQDYFAEICETPLKILQSRYSSTALVESAFKTYFDKLITDHDIEEYYLVDDRGTFLMIDSKNEAHSLITLDDERVETYLASESGDTLTSSQRQSLKKRELIPCYYHPFEKPNLEPDDLKDWLHKPTVIEGKIKPFYCVFGKGFIQVEMEQIKLLLEN